MSGLKKFWPTVESLPSLAAVESEWLALLQYEYYLIKPFLRQRNDLAKSFPRPEGLPYKVIKHGPQDYVGVCEETGETISLSKSQLAIYELDQQQLADQVASALGLRNANKIETSECRLFSLGSFRPVGYSVAAFLIFPTDSADIASGVAILISEGLSPFLLLTPTARFVTGELELRLRSVGSAHLPLADALVVSDDCQWSIAASPIQRSLPDQLVGHKSSSDHAQVVIQFVAGDRGGGPRSQLKIPREEKGIREAVEHGRFREEFVFAPSIFSASINDVTACRQQRPTIFHFVGHGEERRLLFMRDRDLLVECTPLDLQQSEILFRSFPTRVRLVVFNTCYSLEFAQHLTAGGVVEMAIGVKDQISDDHAVRFAESFYRCLSDGDNVQQAFNLAGLNLTGSIASAQPQLCSTAGVDPAIVVFGGET